MNRLIAPLAAVALASVALFAAPANAQASGPFKNCTEARAAGRTDIPEGDPAYAPHLDQPKDGVACESGDGPATTRPKAAPTTRKPTTPTTATPGANAVRATPRFTG
jgi:hypothetical protein